MGRFETQWLAASANLSAFANLSGNWIEFHALAYNFGNFIRTLATPVAIRDWTLTSLREKLIKIGAKVVSHGRYVTFQMPEVAIPCDVFAELLQRIAALRSPSALALT
jgi:hypothetical protein